VLPWAREAFVRSSVPRKWQARFGELCDTADSLKSLGDDQVPEDNAGYEYATLVMGGMALLEARTQGLELVPLVFWDGKEGRPGGTGFFVEFWRSRGFEPVHVSSALALEEYAQRVGRASLFPQTASPPSRRPISGPLSSRARGRTLGCQIKTMLFADVVGYSKLSESVIPAYVEHFLGLVSRLAANSHYPPISVNTWGDAIYFVFDEAAAGGAFALELVDAIAQTPWERFGVYWEDSTTIPPTRRPLTVRTGLHTGPVYVHFDPIVCRLGFTGAHVSRAARIEPITPPAQIYASEEFAAAAAAAPETRFGCEFVGTMPLAKQYPGQYRLYRLRANRPLDIEELGQRIHENYCRAELQQGDSPDQNPSLVPWELLPDDLRQENRAQAEHIKTKLGALGFELVPGPDGAQLARLWTPEQQEQLARWEHERWCQSKQSQGWRYGPRRNNQEKLHPSLVDWDELPEDERRKDRDAVRAIPELLKLAGLQVRRNAIADAPVPAET
jgi:class 3 adenylate cyclase